MCWLPNSTAKSSPATAGKQEWSVRGWLLNSRASSSLLRQPSMESLIIG